MESNESDLERLKRYIKECKACAAEEGVEVHISKLKGILEKYSSEKTKKVVRTFKALGNPLRIKILLLLLEKDEISIRNRRELLNSLGAENIKIINCIIEVYENYKKYKHFAD
jgi:hypothetical protein